MTAAAPTTTTKKTNSKKAAKAAIKPVNAAGAAMSEIVSSGLLTEEEAGQFAVVNPDLHYYRMLDRDDETIKYGIRGIPVERRQRPDDEESFYYVIALTAPAVLFDGDGNKIEAGPGDFAWVDERYAFQALKGFLPQRTMDAQGMVGIVGCHEVVIYPDRKINLKGGKTLWKATIQARSFNAGAAGMNLLPPAGDPAALAGQAGETEEIPF